MRPSRWSSADALRTSALLFVLLVPAAAQQRISSALIRPAPADTPAVSLEAGAILLPPPEEKSTLLAMSLSAVLPGAGQVYTERYLSIPIIWGFGTYFGSQYVKMNDRYKDFRAQFDVSVRADTLRGVGNDRLRQIRDFYRDERDTFAIYLGLTYILNIVDAYVGAALYGFDVSPDLGGGGRVEVRVKL